MGVRWICEVCLHFPDHFDQFYAHTLTLWMTSKAATATAADHSSISYRFLFIVESEEFSLTIFSIAFHQTRSVIASQFRAVCHDDAGCQTFSLSNSTGPRAVLIFASRRSDTRSLGAFPFQFSKLSVTVRVYCFSDIVKRANCYCAHLRSFFLVPSYWICVCFFFFYFIFLWVDFFLPSDTLFVWQMSRRQCVGPRNKM